MCLPDMDPGLIDRAAALLISAQSGPRLHDLPIDCAPSSLEAAYAIQEAVLRSEAVLAGWKVAPAKEGETPRCAAIGASRLLADGATLPEGLHEPEVEVEVALRLGRDLPPRDLPYARADIQAAVASVHVAFEVLDSRFLDRRTLPMLTSLADGQSNRLVIIGEGVEEWRNLDFAALRPALTILEEVRATKEMASTASVLDACCWLADHAGQRGRGLLAGEVIITGARVGPIPIPTGSVIEGSILGIGRVRVSSPLTRPMQTSETSV